VGRPVPSVPDLLKRTRDADPGGERLDAAVDDLEGDRLAPRGAPLQGDRGGVRGVAAPTNQDEDQGGEDQRVYEEPESQTSSRKTISVESDFLGPSFRMRQ
jgi:hypothetical protein